jgi:hypothetical protein
VAELVDLIEGPGVRLTAPLLIEGGGVVYLIERVGVVRLIERVVTLGSAGVDRRRLRGEADRGSLLIERVVILWPVALWIEGVGVVRLIERTSMRL